MYMESLEDADRGIVISGKYSIERDPLSITQEVIQDLEGDVAFEFSVQNQMFVKGDSIRGERRFIPQLTADRVLLIEWTPQEQNPALPMVPDQVFHELVGDLCIFDCDTGNRQRGGRR